MTTLDTEEPADRCSRRLKSEVEARLHPLIIRRSDEDAVMSDPADKNATVESAEIEREARTNRKFSFSEAIGQMGGGDFMKGGSPVTRKRQAELEIDEYLLHPKHSYVGAPPGGVRPRRRRGVGTGA
jgi:hypothetical protein